MPRHATDNDGTDSDARHPTPTPRTDSNGRPHPTTRRTAATARQPHHQAITAERAVFSIRNTLKLHCNHSFIQCFFTPNAGLPHLSTAGVCTHFDNTLILGRLPCQIAAPVQHSGNSNRSSREWDPEAYILEIFTPVFNGQAAIILSLPAGPCVTGA